MRKTGKVAGFIAAAAVVAGLAAPATAAVAATGREGASPPTSVAFSPGSGRSVVDWNHELITILGTPGAQPATVHPTRSFAILQAAEYDAVVSITHAARPYLFSVQAPSGARPDAAADQAALDLSLGARLREALEVAAYYVASEALTNAAKHAHASVIDMRVVRPRRRPHTGDTRQRHRRRRPPPRLGHHRPDRPGRGARRNNLGPQSAGRRNNPARPVTG